MHAHVPESPTEWTMIGNMRPYQKGINASFIVLEKDKVYPTKDGNRVTQFLVGDPSGACVLSVWDELGDQIKPSDILQLINGYTTLHHGMFSLQRGKDTVGGRIEKVGEFTMAYQETPNLSKGVWEEHADKSWTMHPHPDALPPPSLKGR